MPGAEVIDARTIPAAFAARLHRTPDAPFVRCGDEWLTFAELDRRADRVAGALTALGVHRGDRVALIIPNRVEMLELFFACARLGVVQVPLNAWLKGEFLRHQLADCRASVLVADEGGIKAATDLLPTTSVQHAVGLDDGSYADLVGAGGDAPRPEIGAGDTASIIYTSGTTGMPKGCVLSHGYYTAGPRALVTRGWVVEGDRLFTAYPLFHTSGQVVALMTALVAGGSVAVEVEFSATTFLDRARDAEATVLCGVGFMGAALLAQPPRPDDRDHRLRLATWIPMAPEQQEAFEERFGVPVITEAFGQTECFPLTMARLDAPRRRDALGVPTDHCEVRVVRDDDTEAAVGEVGEIVVRPREPDSMYSGYWDNPTATVMAWRNLWHHTGDLARSDETGALHFVDRKKDAIRRRGENVSSVELEAAIATHPAVQQVAVCAVPAAMGEDDIKACVVLRAEAEVTPEAMFAFFRDHLPYFAVPRYVDVRGSLPTNALGRIMKHALRDEGTDHCWDLDALGLRVGRGERR